MGAVLVAVSVEPPEHVPGLLRSSQSRQKLAGTTAAEQSESAQQDPPCQLRSNLFIGSADTEAALYRAAAGSSISHILQVGVELQPTHPQQFRYAQLACSDTETQDIVGLFSQAFQFIDEGRNNGGGVLVHCAQGVSRSASVLIGYLMAREGLPYEAALAQLQGARPRVAPNPGFALQLQEFGRSGCCLEAWRAAGGWDAQRLDDCFAQVSVSRRKEVCGLASMVRAFHMADVGEEDTVFDCRSFLL